MTRAPARTLIPILLSPSLAGDGDVALLENVLLALGVAQLLPVALAGLARGQAAVLVVDAQRVELVAAPVRVAAGRPGLVVRAARALGEVGDVSEQRAQRGKRAGDQAGARLDDGPDGDVGDAVEIVAGVVVVEQVAQPDEGGGTGAVALNCLWSASAMVRHGREWLLTRHRGRGRRLQGP